MRRINFPLLIGIAIVMILISVWIFQDRIMQMDPYAINLGKAEYVDGEFITTKPPLPPNEDNIFGTDILGRDIFSRLVAGLSITFKIVLIATLFRFIIALPMAFFAGFGSGVSSRIIQFFSTVFSAIPALIISIMILSFTAIRSMEIEQAVLVFGVVLALTGWGRLAGSLKERIEDILSEDFIQGEVAIGKSKFLIAVQNVVPHIIPSVIVHVFLQMANVLISLAALGAFGVYAGISKIKPETIYELKLSILPGYNPEWGGMLASARYAITLGTLWVVLFPALAFFISIVGLNLLGEGLQHEINKRNSMVLTWIKRGAFHLSPKTYVYEIRHFTRYRRNVFAKTLIVILIFLVPLIPSAKSVYEINVESLYSHLEELSKDSYEGRMVGTEGRDKAAQYIASELKSYNISPLYEDGYIHEKELTSPITYIKDAKLVIEDEQTQEVLETFDYRKNFTFNTVFYNDEKAGTNFEAYQGINQLSAEIITYDQIKEDAFDKEKDYFVVMDSYEGWYSTPITEVMDIKCIKGVIVPVNKEEDLEFSRIPNIKGTFFYGLDHFGMMVDKETFDSIKSHAGKDITLKHDCTIMQKSLKNVGGIIEGKDKDHPIVLVTSYDYLGSDVGGQYKGLYENGTSMASILEIGRVLGETGETPERTLVFAFIDASKFHVQGAMQFGMNDSMGFDTFFIYLNYLGLEDSSSLYMDSSSITSSTGDYFDMIQYFNSRAEAVGISVIQDTLRNQDVEQLGIGGSSGFVLQSTNMETLWNYYGLKQNDLTLINQDKLKNQTQLILDTLVSEVLK